MVARPIEYELPYLLVVRSEVFYNGVGDGVHGAAATLGAKQMTIGVHRALHGRNCPRRSARSWAEARYRSDTKSRRAMSAPGHEQSICDGRSHVGFSRKRPSAAPRHPDALGHGRHGWHQRSRIRFRELTIVRNATCACGIAITFMTSENWLDEGFRIPSSITSMALQTTSSPIVRTRRASNAVI
jgi:hypothetical protein